MARFTSNTIIKPEIAENLEYRMARNPITIGEMIFTSKTAALSHYKTMLAKYSFGSIVDDEDYSQLIDLANYVTPDKETYSLDESVGVSDRSDEFDDEEVNIVDEIVVDRHPFFRTTKCFYFVYGEDKSIFSYILSINGGYSNEQLFYISCKNSINETLRTYKMEVFRNRPVKCLISNKELEWEECHIDHKSPMTFSVIVRTFLKSNDIDVDNIEYSHEGTVYHFQDDNLSDKFRKYHNSVAILRTISKVENMKLASKARIKPTKNDFSFT